MIVRASITKRSLQRTYVGWLFEEIVSFSYRYGLYSVWFMQARKQQLCIGLRSKSYNCVYTIVYWVMVIKSSSQMFVFLVKTKLIWLDFLFVVLILNVVFFFIVPPLYHIITTCCGSVFKRDHILLKMLMKPGVCVQVKKKIPFPRDLTNPIMYRII